MTRAPEGWDGILEPGETVLWQGRPGVRVSVRELEARRVGFGLIFAGFAVFWMISAARAGASGPMGAVFPLFGLPFLVLGLKLAGAGIFWDAFLRRRSWYTLTNRRAFIATDVFGRRSLESWPITPETVIDFDDGPEGGLWFADRPAARWKVATRTGRERIGFEQIDGVHEVLRLMRQVQRGAT